MDGLPQALASIKDIPNPSTESVLPATSRFGTTTYSSDSAAVVNNSGTTRNSANNPDYTIVDDEATGNLRDYSLGEVECALWRARGAVTDLEAMLTGRSAETGAATGSA